MIMLTSSVSKSFVFEMFSVFLSLKRKACISNSCSLNSVLKKLRCRGGLVWTESLIGETKLRFQCPPTYRTVYKEVELP